MDIRNSADFFPPPNTIQYNTNTPSLISHRGMVSKELGGIETCQVEIIPYPSHRVNGNPGASGIRGYDLSL